jgi:phosphoribosyl 1,2-cyclic phosphodiesterase
MILKVINTGSKGNAYLLETEKEALLIECGVNFSEIKKAIDFKVSKIVACIVSHEHLDHFKSANDVMKSGIDVFATQKTLDCNMIKNVRKMPVEKMKTYQVGGFKFLPFGVKHDAADPVGFLIHHEDCGKVLFLTDTFYCEHLFEGLNNIIIEANYSEKLISDKNEFLRNRILKSHFSLENCIGLLKANDLSKVNNIAVIHLSDTNSDEIMFKTEIEKETNSKVTIASAGMNIEFNKRVF